MTRSIQIPTFSGPVLSTGFSLTDPTTGIVPLAERILTTSFRYAYLSSMSTKQPSLPDCSHHHDLDIPSEDSEFDTEFVSTSTVSGSLKFPHGTIDDPEVELGARLLEAID